MKTRVALFAVLAAALVVPVAARAGETSNVKVINHSDWEIHELYMSPVDQDKWGPDQLRDNIIATGATFELRGVPCDTFDVKLVDEDGDECVVGGVDICGEDQGWVISSDDLLDCQAKTDDGGDEE